MSTPVKTRNRSHDDLVRHLESAMKTLRFDLGDEVLRETPQRVAELWADLFRGLEPEHAPRLTDLSPAPEGAGMVRVRDVRFYSMCAHHLLPFFGTAEVAYLPGRSIVGLGAVPRVVDYLARRPTLQENLGDAIAAYLEEHLTPRGVAVRLEARHLCLEMRGEKPSATLETYAYRGVYREPDARREFLERP